MHVYFNHGCSWDECMGKSVDDGENLITNVYISLHSRCLLKCLVEIKWMVNVWMHVYIFSSFLNAMADWTWENGISCNLYITLIVSTLSFCCDDLHVELEILVVIFCTTKLILEFSIFFGKKYYLFESIKLFA